MCDIFPDDIISLYFVGEINFILLHILKRTLKLSTSCAQAHGIQYAAWRSIERRAPDSRVANH